MEMAAKKQEPPAESPNDLVPFTFRMPRWIIEALDEWVDEENKKPGPHKVTRSDLIRLALSEAAAHRPDFSVDAMPDAPVAGLRNFWGRFFTYEGIEGDATRIRDFVNPADPKQARIRGRLVSATYQVVAEPVPKAPPVRRKTPPL